MTFIIRNSPMPKVVWKAEVRFFINAFNTKNMAEREKELKDITQKCTEAHAFFVHYHEEEMCLHAEGIIESAQWRSTFPTIIYVSPRSYLIRDLIINIKNYSYVGPDMHSSIPLKMPENTMIALTDKEEEILYAELALSGGREA